MEDQMSSEIKIIDMEDQMSSEIKNYRYGRPDVQ